MAETDKPTSVIALLNRLQHLDEAKRLAAAPAGLDPGLARLRSWQAERLARTYADLLDDPGCAPACRFFLSDIYAARDFSQRDYDFERLHAILSRFLPAIMLQLLSRSIELNTLTNALDWLLLRALEDHLGGSELITAQSYAEGYRICANYKERADQIALLYAVLKEVTEGVRLPVVGISLKMVHLPAKRAGWQEAYDFLARGHQAFKDLRNPGYFVETICRRETRILDNIFAGALDPFQSD